uniref:Kinetochore protein SPC25 n=1 Tax=Arion vulgaris TaxID=1028688 RepID=A0A0B6Z8H6_9EUPU
MDELTVLLSKLQNSGSQMSAEFENILTLGAGRDQKKSLQKKLHLLETTIEDQLTIHKKADTNNKQQLNSLQQESEVKRTKMIANDTLISALLEELSHLQVEKEYLREAQSVEPETKYLEEEETYSVKQLSLEIKKVKGGWLQFVFTNINHQKPDSCYTFSLKLDENRKYLAGDCQPEITDMDVLIEKLNSSNNISTFVRSVRKRFTAMARK